MVELRKRKERADPPPPPPSKRKSSSSVKKVVDKAKAAVTGKSETPSAAGAGAAPTVGSSVSLDDFGGEVETNEGEKTTLKKLVDASKGGVVLFTYPKASTPGCTTQACLFRDSYAPLTATGLALYGLSRDTAKANTAFRTKQALPYPLLCDPGAGLVTAIGMAKAGSGTTRGVFAVDKAGKVLLAEAGGPAATVDAVKRIVGTEGDAPPAAAPAPAAEGKAEGTAPEEKANGEPLKETPSAVAADVADSAAKIDAPTAAA